jgi:hypothetical protein
MCDTNWSSRGKELQSLEKSWREFEEVVQWIKHRWSKRRVPDPTATDTESSRKPQPVTG